MTFIALGQSLNKQVCANTAYQTSMTCDDPLPVLFRRIQRGKAENSFMTDELVGHIHTYIPPVHMHVHVAVEVLMYFETCIVKG